MTQASGFISLVLTDGSVGSRENINLFDLKVLFFVILFTLIYAFIVDQGRAINTQSIDQETLNSGGLGCLFGVMLTFTLPAKEQSLGWQYTI